MNKEVPSGRVRHASKKSSGRFPLSALAMGLALLYPGLSHAAGDAAANSSSGQAGQGSAVNGDETVAGLKAQVEKLKKALEKTQQELAAKGGNDTLPSAQQTRPSDDAQPAQATQAANGTAQLGQVEVRSAARSPIASLQNVPQSTSVVTGAELDQTDAVTLSNITQRAGNVSWNLGNSRTSSLSIRGVGKQAQTDAMDPSVGINVDGVPYAYNPLSSFDFTDLADVQVARGPQGTQGGKNADLGFLNIQTRRPSFTPDQEYSITLGQLNTVLGRAAVGGPVIDDLLAWRGTLSVDKGSGAIKNEYNSDYSYQNLDNISGRVQFLLTSGANFTALLRLDYEPTNSSYYNGWTIFTPTPTKYANGAVNPLSSDASTRLARSWFTQEGNYSYLSNYLSTAPDDDNQDPLVTSSKGASTELNWNIGGQTLTSITAYKGYYFQARNDEGTPFDISKNGGGAVTYHQASQELRLSSQEGGLVDYQTGVYLLQTANNYGSGSGYGSDAGAWFASSSQYATLDADANGKILMSNSLNRLQFVPLQHIRNASQAIYGQADWHLSDPLTLTTGVRVSREDRKNSESKLITDEGYAPELDPASFNGVNLDGFNSTSTGALGTNSAAQLAVANATALKYFGSSYSSYSLLSTKQMAEVAAAKAIRSAQLGVLWNNVEGHNYLAGQPTYLISPSYKINNNVTAYLSWRFSEKAGISEVVNSAPFIALPETSSAYELGIKSTLLHKTLVFDADVFVDYIRNYQQAVDVLDTYSTNLSTAANGVYTPVYISTTGNAPKVHVSGLEIDSIYTPFPSLSVRLSGAYNNAVYKSFSNSADPLEDANLQPNYRSVAGDNLPGAAKFTVNVSADYRQPVFSAALFHSSINYAYSSRFNSDPLLSSYGWVHAFGTADFAIGLGRRDQRYDVSVIVKNLFNDQTSQVVLWNSYVPAIPRWAGVQFSARL